MRAPNDLYIFFMVSGYAVLFYNMVYKHREDNVFTYSQLAYINDRTNAQTVEQMKYKTTVSYVYFFVALLLLAIEITCQAMFVNLNMSAYSLIVFYEISILVIMTFITVMWRPRVYSPFYFMEAVTNVVALDVNTRRNRYVLSVSTLCLVAHEHYA